MSPSDDFKLFFSGQAYAGGVSGRLISECPVGMTCESARAELIGVGVGLNLWMSFFDRFIIGANYQRYWAFGDDTADATALVASLESNLAFRIQAATRLAGDTYLLFTMLPEFLSTNVKDAITITLATSFDPFGSPRPPAQDNSGEPDETEEEATPQ